jgi:formylmethanofuran dehydrogenase subunit E
MSKMNKYLLVLLLLVGSSGATEWAQKFYSKVKPINMREPFGVIVGSLTPDNPVVTISLTDVGLYTGHICPGVATGYMAIFHALDSLYPGEIPARGEIKVIAGKPSDLLDVASYITGARSFYGRGEINKDDIIIDKKLDKGPFKLTMWLVRKDNGRTVEVVVDKSKLFKNPEQAKQIEKLKEKVLERKASEKEKEIIKEKLQKKVRQILFDEPEGLIQVRVLKTDTK